MADINYEELEDLTLTMEDEDGTTTECELQFVFEYDGQDYGFAGNRIGRIYRRSFPDEKVINFIIGNYGNFETSFGRWRRAASGLPEKQPEAVGTGYDSSALHGRE